MRLQSNPRRWTRRAGAVALSAMLLGTMSAMGTASAAASQKPVAAPAAAAETKAAALAAPKPKRGPAAPMGSDPYPECTEDVERNCWDYYGWYWTYAGCHTDGRDFKATEPQYDQYRCAGDHGLVVWLWLHKD